MIIITSHQSLKTQEAQTRHQTLTPHSIARRSLHRKNHVLVRSVPPIYRRPQSRARRLPCTVGKKRGTHIGAPTLSRSQTSPANHGTARRSLSIEKTIEDSAVLTWWTCHKSSRSIRLSRSASGAFRTPRVVKLPLWGNKSRNRMAPPIWHAAGGGGVTLPSANRDCCNLCV